MLTLITRIAGTVLLVVLLGAKVQATFVGIMYLGLLTDDQSATPEVLRPYVLEVRLAPETTVSDSSVEQSTETAERLPSQEPLMEPIVLPFSVERSVFVDEENSSLFSQ